MIRKLVRKALGIDKTDRRAHTIKNQQQREILEIQQRVYEVNKYIKSTTAYKVAKAAGRIK